VVAVVQVKADIQPQVLAALAVVERVVLARLEPLEPQTPVAAVEVARIPEQLWQAVTAQVVLLSSATLARRQEPPAAP
jgi:hypothetical protein